mgnify:CR=1 FL=1
MAKAGKAGKRVAVIGLGRMGGLMAKHLAAAGYRVSGYDPSPAAAAAAGRNGVATARSAAEAARGAEVVCSSLPTVEAVRDTYLGRAGLLAALERGTVVFEHSTSEVGLAREIAAAARKRGVAFLDAPVSGSVPHLTARQVSAIVGGDKRALDRHSDVLRVFSKSITYMGPAGNGLIMKLVTNHILGIHHAGMAEGLALGVKAGLEPKKMMTFLAQSALTGLWTYRGPEMAARDYSRVVSEVNISKKDMGLSVEEAAGRCVPVPLGVAARQQYVAAAALGLARADFNTVFEAYIHAMGGKVKQRGVARAK